MTRSVIIALALTLIGAAALSAQQADPKAAALTLIGAAALSAQQADPKAAALRDLLQRHGPQIVVLNWTSTTSAMGQTVESTGTATGVLVGDSGLVMVSGQPFNASVGGVAAMFGRGQSTGPTAFRARNSAGTEFPAAEAADMQAQNLRAYALKPTEGAKHAGAVFPENVEVPALGEEVVIIGAHDAALNHARFFRLARLNAVIEDGKTYGLDGAIQDCLGGLVVTLQGRVLGVVAQRNGEAAGQDAGLGRMLGGLSDPSRMLGNRVLITPAVFAAGLKDAAAKAATLAWEGAPKPATPAGGFEGTVASARRREATKDLWLLVNVGANPPAVGTELVVHDSADKPLCRFKVEQHYTRADGTVDQVGGAVADPEGKLELRPGLRVRVAATAREFRGVDQFMKLDAEAQGETYGGAKAGFIVARAPTPESAAAVAGLRQGDLIVKVNETAIEPAHTLDDLWKLLRVDGEVTLVVTRRGGETATLKVAG